MTQPPESSRPENQPPDPSGQPAEPAYDGPPPDQPQYEPPPQYGQPQYEPPPQYGQPQYAQPAYQQPAVPGAPYGVHPLTGIPYSDKSKLAAGLLNILLPFGIGRFYIGDTGIGVAQLLVSLLTCGIGGLWSLVDGIILLTSDSRDAHGYMLRS